MHNAVLALMIGLGFLLLTLFAAQKPRIAQVVPLQLSLGIGIGVMAAIVILALSVDLVPDDLEIMGLIVLLGTLAVAGAGTLWWRRLH